MEPTPHLGLIINHFIYSASIPSVIVTLANQTCDVALVVSLDVLPSGRRFKQRAGLCHL